MLHSSAHASEIVSLKYFKKNSTNIRLRRDALKCAYSCSCCKNKVSSPLQKFLGFHISDEWLSSDVSLMKRNVKTMTPLRARKGKRRKNKLIQIKSKTINKHSFRDVQILARSVSNNWDMEVA